MCGVTVYFASCMIMGMLMKYIEIPESVWESAVVVDGVSQQNHRMNILWTYLSTVENPDAMLTFPMLSKVVYLVLVLPYLNAQEESVFSLVTKNKTAFRPSLRWYTFQHFDCEAGKS